MLGFSTKCESPVGVRNLEHHGYVNVGIGGQVCQGGKRRDSLTHLALPKFGKVKILLFDPCKNKASVWEAFFTSRVKCSMYVPLVHFWPI